MATLTHQLLSVTVILGLVRLISTYGFKNCIDKESKRHDFMCVHRKVNNISEIIGDLPNSAINLSISSNDLQVKRIFNKSFIRFPNLQHLRIDQNKLTTIDQSAFSNLYQLKTLNLSSNMLSELHPNLFQDLDNLTLLSLSNNQLKQLPQGIFSKVSNLETVIMRENQLTNFSVIAKSVSHLSKLKKLDLCVNNLTSLTHPNNISLPKSLTVFYLCRNQMNKLGCQKSFLKSIKLLDLSNNSGLHAVAFTEIDLSRINHLRIRSTNINVSEFLNISNINASHVDFSGTGQKNDTLIIELCKLLKKKLPDSKPIQNLTLSDNEIRSVNNSTFYYCPNITKHLDLSYNRLTEMDYLTILSRHTQLKKLDVEHNLLKSIPSCKNDSQVYLNLEELSYRYNRILSVSAYAFVQTPNIKTLKLNINNIAYFDNQALKKLEQLEILRLDNNLLTDLSKNTFEDQINLKILILRNNRISVIFSETFHNLSNLIILDLGGNKITHIEKTGLVGLKKLSKLYLDGNNFEEIDSSLYHAFQHTLKVLDLQNNKISFQQNISPFLNLTRLSDLKLDRQRPYGLIILPRTLFRGLYLLETLCLTNNQIFHLPLGVFDDLISLKFLTLNSCCNGVATLQPGLFKNLRNLTKLTAENMGIRNFSKEVFGNLTNLRSLQLNHNVMTSIPVDALESLPKLRYLDIRNIPLSCTCENDPLQNYTLKQNIQVVYLQSLPCPDNKIHFFNFDTNVCYIDLGKYLFFSTAFVIFMLTVTPLLYVKLYWKTKYGYYVFRAWFSQQWSSFREEEEKCKYDAFISYNSSDEQWVMHQLLPNLERNGSNFKLCFHHRDFELGRDIVDNIVSAVYSSRKTICVVSRNFLQSEWCSLEIQLASYRLFDEHRDVLLLVFLEPISERQLSSYHRMRKVMLKKTYLQWPGSDCINPIQAQEVFWNQLRRAIRTGNKQALDDNEIDEETEDHTSVEDYYLLP